MDDKQWIRGIPGKLQFRLTESVEWVDVDSLPTEPDLKPIMLDHDISGTIYFSADDCRNFAAIVALMDDRLKRKILDRLCEFIMAHAATPATHRLFRFDRPESTQGNVIGANWFFLVPRVDFADDFMPALATLLGRYPGIIL